MATTLFDPIPVVEGDGSSLFVRVLSVMDKDPMRPWQVSTVDPIVPGGIEYWTYGFDSEMQSDLASGIRMVFMSVDATHENVGALWLLDDIYRTKTFMEATNSGWEHTRFVHWQPGFDEMSPCTRSCFLPIVGPNGVFIAHSSIGSPDVVVHELGHSYLFRALGLDFYLNVPAYLRCLEHFTFAGTNDVCAWSEGWADFLPLLVNGDQCFDYDTPGPCTPPDPVSGNIRSDDLELQWLHDNRGDEGYHVEGRVAGALYDIADNGVDLLDDRSYGMGAISTVVLPPKVYTPDTARQFRNEWYYVWGDEKPISQIYLQNALIDRTYLPLQLKQ